MQAKKGGEMIKPFVVIGHRMGEGENVARGVKKAGGTPFVIPGFTADMKLGQVMHEKQADFGISFCGSGGAGAITAANQFNYKQKSSIRTVIDGVNALKQGYEVLGFGFMDIEELGYELVKVWKEIHE